VSSRRGMGQGLAAILPATADAEAELHEIPVELIKPSPRQPRTRFDSGALEELTTSIEASGVVQPLLLRPLADGSYELVAGERRWRAAKQAGLERVPALVRDSAETEALQTALVENMVREDLNPIDEARACAALVEDLKLSKEEVGRRVGRSRSAISNLIRLLDLPDEAMELLESGQLSEGHGRAVLQVRDYDLRRRLALAAADNGWSVRETENRAKLASDPSNRKGREKRQADPELKAALTSAAEALESALGHEVTMKSRAGGVCAELRFDDVEEALSLARALARKRAA